MIIDTQYILSLSKEKKIIVLQQRTTIIGSINNLDDVRAILNMKMRIAFSKYADIFLIYIMLNRPVNTKDLLLIYDKRLVELTPYL